MQRAVIILDCTVCAAHAATAWRTCERAPPPKLLFYAWSSVESIIISGKKLKVKVDYSKHKNTVCMNTKLKTQLLSDLQGHRSVYNITRGANGESQTYY